MASGSSPQVEDGYTRIANELFDAALAYPFTGRQLKVFMAIVRKTYGYNKKRDDLSASQIGDLCGVARNHVTSTLNELSNLNIITKLPGEFGSLIEINKNYRRWADPLGGNTSQNRTSPKSGHVSKNRTSPESGHVTNKVMDLDFSSPKSGLVPNQDRSIVPNQDTQKTTFQKTTNKRLQAGSWPVPPTRSNRRRSRHGRLTPRHIAAATKPIQFAMRWSTGNWRTSASAFPQTKRRRSLRSTLDTTTGTT